MTRQSSDIAVRSKGRRRRIALASGAATALIMPLLIAGPGISPALALEQTFTYTGSTQSFSIPEGVTAIQVTATGASGGTGGGSGKAGGKGGIVTTTVQVVPFQTLYVNVGGQGAGGAGGGQGGFNGNGNGGVLTNGTGGGGGGATDLRVGFNDTDRVVVAGGGGGGGAGSSGGTGGAAIASGGPNGQPGAAGSASGTAGNAGTVSAPGAAVSNGGGAGDVNPGVGTGGSGGDEDGGVTQGINGGGGGGGGWHGGSGGGSDDGTNGGGGGGGAGSSHAPDPVLGAPAPAYSTASVAGNGSLVVRMIQISTAVMPTVHVGQSYSAALTSDDSNATWSVSPALWSGLTLTAATGVVSGTIASLPANASQYFTFTATDPNTGAVTNKVLQMVVENGSPHAPTDVVATRGNKSELVSWTPAADGAAATSYRIESSDDNGTTWSVAVADTNSAATSRTITGLDNGASYLFRVSGINAVGVGAASLASSAVVPATVPDAPTGLSVTAVMADSAMVSLNAPVSDGGDPITSYTVTSSPAGITCTIYSTSTPCTFDGVGGTGHSSTPLSTGVAYTFTATASNTVGDSAASASTQSITTGQAPDAPQNLVVTRGDGKVDLNWDAPDYVGGSAIAGYRILKSTDGGTTWSTVRSNTGNTNTWYTVTGLANGTPVLFNIAALNTFGWGAQSSDSDPVTPAGLPGAPTGLVVNAVSKTSATVTFSAPALTGGDAITGYQVTSSPGGIVCSRTNLTPPLTCVFDGAGGDGHSATALTTGVAYTFTATASNSVGESTTSAQTQSVTAGAAPGAPTGLVVSAVGPTSATVAFSAPVSDGGDPITGYQVTSSPGGIVCSRTNLTPPLTCAFDGAGGDGHSTTALTTGVTYSFTATASNSVGTSAVSAQTQSVTTGAVPDAPQNLVASRGDGKVDLSWDAPQSGGSAILGYRILKSIDGGATWLTVRSNTGNADAWYTVTGLTNGTPVVFSVMALNTFGWGAQSASSAAVVPAGAPGAPTGLVVSAVGPTSATVTFNAPASTGGDAITGYQVMSSPGGIVCSLTNLTPPLTCVFDGAGGDGHSSVALTIGTTYTFTATATNGVGTSVPSSPTPAVLTGAVPDAPSNLTVTRGNTTAELMWDAPEANGSPISGYRIQKSVDGGAIWTNVRSNTGNTETSLTVSGLSNGTSYVFAVSARNSIGWSAPSDVSDPVTPATVPDAPTNVLVGAVTATTANVSFQAPAWHGGSPVTSYTVISSPTGAQCTTTTTWCTFSGLTTGVAYTFTVVARNDVGLSAASSPSPTVTSSQTPSQVTGLTVDGTSSRSLVQWYAPVSDGGAQITSYTVYRNNIAVCTVPGLTTQTMQPSQKFHCDVRQSAVGLWTVQARNESGAGVATSKQVTLAMSGKTKGSTLTLRGVSSSPRKWVTVKIKSGSVTLTKRVKSNSKGVFKVTATIKNPKKITARAAFRGLQAKWVVG